MYGLGFGRAYRKLTISFLVMMAVLSVPLIAFEYWHWTNGRPMYVDITVSRSGLHLAEGHALSWTSFRGSTISSVLGGLFFFPPLVLGVWGLRRIQERAAAADFNVCPACITPTPDKQPPRPGEKCLACGYTFNRLEYREFLESCGAKHKL